MKFNLNNYKGKYAMHCKNLEECKNFCSFLHLRDRKWASGERYTDWYGDKDFIKDGTMCYDFNNNRYSDIEWYKKEGYIILEWSDFMRPKESFTKDNLKTGMVVELRDGGKMLVLKNTQSEIEADIFKQIKNNKILNIWDNFGSYQDNLTHKHFTDLDIIKVYCSEYSSEVGTVSQDVIWERKDKEIELTIEEIEEKLGIKNLKIVKGK